MRNIKISNFGPINDASIDLTDRYHILIGPQASGKSTICRVVYFCRKIRDYSLDYIMDPELMQQSHQNEILSNYFKFLTKRFMACFGTTKHMDSFVIKYTFDGQEISIGLVDGYVKFVVSKALKNEIHELLIEANELYREINNSAYMLKDMLKENGLMRQQLSNRINKIFRDESDIIYIPAGRSVLSTMSEQLQDLPFSSIDLTMQEFMNRIRDTRINFGSRIPDMVQDYLKTVKGQINDSAVKLAYELIHSILKADYISDKGGEKIFYDNDRWVKLLFASSGQQESLWVLLPCFLQILQRRKSLVIIEEPEAHLFPDSQKSIVELITLLVNSTGSSVMITTHSPYILTATNLLLFSGAVENQTERGPAVVKPILRLSSDSFSAHSIECGVISDIYDSESHMLNAEYIDKISSVINQELDALLEKWNEV